MSYIEPLAVFKMKHLLNLSLSKLTRANYFSPFLSEHNYEWFKENVTKLKTTIYRMLCSTYFKVVKLMTKIYRILKIDI